MLILPSIKDGIIVEKDAEGVHSWSSTPTWTCSPHLSARAIKTQNKDATRTLGETRSRLAICLPFPESGLLGQVNPLRLRTLCRLHKDAVKIVTALDA